MAYINTDTLQYPFFEQEIRALYPNTSFGTPFTPPAPFKWVFPSPVPAYGKHEYPRELSPSLISGQWYEAWEIVTRQSTPEALAAAKAEKNDEINAARLAANFSNFTYAGKTFSCDTLSRSDIDGINGYVALFSAFPAGWPGGWKATDNTYIPISTINDWKQFYAAMVAAGNTNFAHAQTLKAQVAAGTTLQEVYAVTW